MKKSWIILTLILILLAAVSVWWVTRNDGEENAIHFSGNIELREVDLSFEFPGEIEALAVEEGDFVSPSQPIGRLNSDQLQKQEEEARAALQSLISREAELRKRILYKEENLAALLSERKAALRQSGELLNELLRGSRKEEIEQAQAVVTAAEAEFERAEGDWNRARTLYQTEDISTDRLEQARAAFRSSGARLEQARERLRLLQNGPREEEIERARAGVERARAGLRQAEAGRLEIEGDRQSLETLAAEKDAAVARIEQIEVRLGKTRLESPIKGVVLVKSAEPGEVVAAGTSVVTLGQISEPWVRGYIPETELGRVKLGSPVDVRTDSYPGKVYEGRISFIASEAEFTPRQIQTREERVKMVYRIKVDLENPNQELKLNMPVDGKIRLGGPEE